MLCTQADMQLHIACWYMYIYVCMMLISIGGGGDPG